MARQTNFQTKLSLLQGAILLLLVLFLIPGLALIAILKELLKINLDTGQIWTFGAVASAILLGFLYHNKQTLLKTCWAYIKISLIVLIIYLIAAFGFKCDFPARFFSQLMGHSPVSIHGNDSSSINQQREVGGIKKVTTDSFNSNNSFSTENKLEPENSTVPNDTEHKDQEFIMEGIYNGIISGDYIYASIIDEKGEESLFMKFNNTIGSNLINENQPEANKGRRCRITYKKEMLFIPRYGCDREILRLVSFSWSEDNNTKN
jgi:ABC-type transport system involved in multi-copper enzyme maturation permease subunit